MKMPTTPTAYATILYCRSSPIKSSATRWARKPTLSRWKSPPSARELTHFNDLPCQHFIRLCGDQVRQRGEILLDLDSTDDPT
jgi:hypothetical protein